MSHVLVNKIVLNSSSGVLLFADYLEYRNLVLTAINFSIPVQNFGFVVCMVFLIDLSPESNLFA